MFFQSVNPGYKFVIRHIAFSSITNGATWDAVFERVTFLVVNAIYAVVFTLERWRIFCFASTVKAWLTRDGMNLILAKLKYQSSLLRTSKVPRVNPVDAMMLSNSFAFGFTAGFPRFIWIYSIEFLCAFRAPKTSLSMKSIRRALKHITAIASCIPYNVPLGISFATVANDGNLSKLLTGEIFRRKSSIVATSARFQACAVRSFPCFTAIAPHEPYGGASNIPFS